jgi:hypothetical protein
MRVSHPHTSAGSRARTAVNILLIATLVGCSAAPRATCEADAKAGVASWLYFGTDSPEGTVTVEAWDAFVDETVTPRFPDGFSVWPAKGQWRTKDQRIVRETAYVMSLVHSGSASERRALNAIGQDYKVRFRQEAVLHVETSVCTRF